MQNYVLLKTWIMTAVSSHFVCAPDVARQVCVRVLTEIKKNLSRVSVFVGVCVSVHS